MGEFSGDYDVTGRSGVPEGSGDSTCVFCDTAASAIVECGALIILIRHGTGLALAGGQIINAYTPEECWNYFAAAGYVALHKLSAGRFWWG